MQLTRGLCAGQAAPSAHRGFLNRARAVPIESLYDMACRQGRRLVLTGAPSGLRAAALPGVGAAARHVGMSSSKENAYILSREYGYLYRFYRFNFRTKGYAHRFNSPIRAQGIRWAARWRR